MGHDHSHHGHDHGHDHDHAHGHGGHSHAPASFGRAFALGVSLNAGFVAIETVYGALSHSVALVADAAHNASDVLGLLAAWVAYALAKRRPTARRTYGLRKSTVLAALANSVLLLVAVGGVAWESIGKLRDPEPIQSSTVMIVAAAGVVVNGASALLFMRGGKSDANLRGAFLHLAADAAVSAAVVISGAIILFTGWYWLDPAISLLVSALVLIATWKLLVKSVNLALDAVPDNVDADAVREHLNGLPGVREVHDFHVWAMSTTETALTAHLVLEEAAPESFLADLGRELQTRFHVDHTTVQIERHAVA
ncbi:MAG: cation transporter, partial [Proteobacteria bacterium]